MNETILLNAGRLELWAFFSGFPLVYLFYQSLNNKSKGYLTEIRSSLPWSYALTGALYLGLVCKEIYPHYGLDEIKDYLLSDYLKIWGLASLVFWLPKLNKKTFFSLFHSLVLFWFFIKEFSNGGKSGVWTLPTLMKVYGFSMLFSLFLVHLTFIFRSFFRRLISE